MRCQWCQTDAIGERKRVALSRSYGIRTPDQKIESMRKKNIPREGSRERERDRERQRERERDRERRESGEREKER